MKAFALANLIADHLRGQFPNCFMVADDAKIYVREPNNNSVKDSTLACRINFEANRVILFNRKATQHIMAGDVHWPPELAHAKSYNLSDPDFLKSLIDDMRVLIYG